MDLIKLSADEVRRFIATATSPGLYFFGFQIEVEDTEIVIPDKIRSIYGGKWIFRGKKARTGLLVNNRPNDAGTLDIHSMDIEFESDAAANNEAPIYVHNSHGVRVFANKIYVNGSGCHGISYQYSTSIQGKVRLEVQEHKAHISYNKILMITTDAIESGHVAIKVHGLLAGETKKEWKDRKGILIAVKPLKFFTGVVVTGNEVYGGYYGLDLSAVSGFGVYENKFQGNMRGVSVQDMSTNGEVIRNNVLNCESAGFHNAFGTNNCVYMFNLAASTKAHGEAYYQAYVGCHHIRFAYNKASATFKDNYPKYMLYAGINSSDIEFYYNRCEGNARRAIAAADNQWSNKITDPRHRSYNMGDQDNGMGYLASTYEMNATFIGNTITLKDPDVTTFVYTADSRLAYNVTTDWGGDDVVRIPMVGDPNPTQHTPIFLDNFIPKSMREMLELKTGPEPSPNPTPLPKPNPSPPPAPDPTPPTPPTPTPTPGTWPGIARATMANVWGPGRYAIEALRNLTVGTKGGLSYAMTNRFVAESSKPLSRVWYYVPFGTTGYHGGNGGIIRGNIYEDDGNGNPRMNNSFGTFSRDIRSTTNGNSKDAMYEDVVHNARALVKGRRYHVTFTNDSAPNGNWYSINTVQVRSYTGHSGTRWVPVADYGCKFSANGGASWQDLAVLNGNTASMVTTPMIRLTDTDGLEYGYVLIESGAPNYRSVILGQTNGPSGTTNAIREAMYISKRMTLKGLSFIGENINGNDQMRITIRKLSGDGTSNTDAGTLWTGTVTANASPARSRFRAATANFAIMEWYDVTFTSDVVLEDGQWIAVDFEAPRGQWRMSGQTNGRRRGTEGGGRQLQLPVSYIDGEARYRNTSGNWIQLNYHSLNTSNGNRNDVNWRGVTLHYVDGGAAPTPPTPMPTPTPTPTPTPGGNGNAPASFKNRVFEMSTGNNPKLIHAWNGRVDKAVQNGTSGQGGGASVVQGNRQYLTPNDGWLLAPWERTGETAWLYKQTFYHYTPWFVFIEIEGSPNKAPAARVAIRNLRLWVLYQGSNTWVNVSQQNTGFWVAYFHPDMGNQDGADYLPRDGSYQGGEAFKFRGNASPWAPIHGSGAQYRFPDGTRFDGLMVTCEAICLTPGAEIALQFGCDAKIFGNNKEDRVWVSDRERGWYPGVGLSRCEPITNSWRTYGFCPIQRADGTVRDGDKNKAITYQRWNSTTIPTAKAPELSQA